MYEAPDKVYCYPGSKVLRNLAGLRTQAKLNAYETIMFAQRAEMPLPAGRFGVAHYRAVHKHLFQDVYAWAGRFRTVRISRGESMFCFPENIEGELRRTLEQLPTPSSMSQQTTDEAVKIMAHMLSIGIQTGL